MKEVRNISEEKKPDAENGSAPGFNVNPGRIGMFGAIALLVFMLGFLPMWLSARGYETERNVAVEKLRPVELQNDLAAAALMAHRGEYEEARLAASNFFTALRQEVDRPDSRYQRQREAVEPILAQRDDLITMLARSEPSSAERLGYLYFLFRRIDPALEK